MSRACGVSVYEPTEEQEGATLARMQTPEFKAAVSKALEYDRVRRASDDVHARRIMDGGLFIDSLHPPSPRELGPAATHWLHTGWYRDHWGIMWNWTPSGPLPRLDDQATVGLIIERLSGRSFSYLYGGMGLGTTQGAALRLAGGKWQVVAFRNDDVVVGLGDAGATVADALANAWEPFAKAGRAEAERYARENPRNRFSFGGAE